MPAEPCPDCGALLPPAEGPTHEYIGASPACWEVFTRITAGVPPIAPTPFTPLVTDAYAAQHPGGASPQATQSVAVHLLTLWEVLVEGASPGRAVTFRTRAVEAGRRHGGWERLQPVPEWTMTIHDVVEQPDPARRAQAIEPYARSVLEGWESSHGKVLEGWRGRVR